MVGTSSAETDPLIGSKLGKDYLVLERIGTGGMAAVYLVEHQTLLKRFAAKVLSSEHASSVEARARFTQEAHAASQLDHENIVTISDFGITTDGRPYFVMELLRGKTLADRLDDGPMAIDEVVAVSVPVGRALAHAHAEGIIHRDVKPENIFLVQRSQGRWSVKVLDFGIAKVPITNRMTKTGEALGSPMFMAPEACRGDEVDQRADIYSFGIVLYLMLAGRVPFEDENLLKVLQMQVVAPLPLPSSFNPDLPAALELVLLRALAKDPNDRYESMDEFLFAIEAAVPDGSDTLLLQAQFGTQTTPFPGTLERVRRVSRPPFASATNPGMQAAALPPAPSRRRGPLVLGILFAAGAAGTGAYVWMQRSDREPKETSDPTTASVAPMPTPAPAVAPTHVEPPVPPVEPPVEPPTTEVEHVAAAIAPTTKRALHPASIRRVAPPTHPKTGSAAPAITNVPVVETPSVATPPPVVEPPPIAQPPTQPPVPSPPVVVPPPAVAIGSTDATPAITNLDVNGPLPASVVRRGIERVLPALRGCYHTAALAQKKTPVLNVTVNFDIDESSTATNVSGGATSFGSLSSCARSAIGQIHTQQAPDVGIAQVGVTILFTPL